MPNKVLFIRFDNDDCGDKEIEAFKALTKLTRYQFIHKDVSDEDSLSKALENNGIKYLILAGHGDESGIGTQNGTINITWTRIGKIICNSGCLQNVIGAKVILFCCKGGVEEVACKFMDVCSQIEFVVGAKYEENSTDLFGVFSNFFFNIEINTRKFVDEEAIHRAQESTGIEIDHFSRSIYDEDRKNYICERCEHFKKNKTKSC